MMGLRTGRVVVIDDDLEEGTALLRAFGRIGVSASYFTGAVEELPERPMLGIRLVALDLVLGGAGGGEAKAEIGAALAAVARIVAPSNGPFVVLAWTKHTDLVEELKKELPKVCPAARPALVLPIAKESVHTAEGTGFDLDKIRAELEAASKRWSPFDLLLLWEQAVHDAASETTETLARIPAANDVDEWRAGLRVVLRRLAETLIGQQETDDQSFLRAVMATLNPLHYHRLDVRAGLIPVELARELASALRESADDPALPLAGVINRMLLTAPVDENDSAVRPGNVYLDGAPWRLPVEPFPLDLEPWLRDTCQNTGLSPRCDAELGTLRALGERDTKQQRRLDELQRREQSCRETLAALKKSAVRIEVEITPSCDHAQRKIRVARIVPGLLIPLPLVANVKRDAEFVWRSDPIRFGEANLAGFPHMDYVMILDARYATSRPLETQRLAIPYSQLRQHVVVAIQAWFAGHAARPGLLSVRDIP